MGNDFVTEMPFWGTAEKMEASCKAEKVEEKAKGKDTA